MQLVFYLPTFSTPCMSYLLYLMFRCDFNWWKVWKIWRSWRELNTAIVLSTKWCASLPFMTCCLWQLVWLPHMTPYSFKVYISRPVWFEFERIKTLKAIGCKVYDMLLGFLWLPSMTSMTVWFLWVKKIQSSNSGKNFVPLHICFYDCMHMFLYYISRTDASITITMCLYDAKIQISITSAWG